MTIRVSDWYTSLGSYTFPTVFIQLNAAQKEALLQGDSDSDAGLSLLERIGYVIDHLPGACFVHADSCAPTDSVTAKSVDGGTKITRTAWRMLQESEKVRAAIRAGETERLAFHPFRRMEYGREFRMFVKGRELKAMSQRFLNKHHPRLEKRRDEIWDLGKRLIEHTRDLLPQDDLAIDVYLTATAKLMILDMNSWGEPTDPLLLRSWNHDWDSEIGLKILPKPMRLSGDISVSF